MNTSFLLYLLGSFLSGIVTFGGGIAFVPIMHGYYVSDYHLISDAAYSKLYIYATSTPGPIAPLIAGYVGYIQFGWLGMFAGIFTLVVPTLILALFLYPYFEKHQEHPVLKVVEQYIRPLLIILFAILMSMQLQVLRAELGHYWIHFLVITLISIFFLFVKKIKVIYIVAMIILYAIVFM